MILVLPLSTTIGEGGFFLLTCIQQASDMQWLFHLPAIRTMSEIWKQQYRGEQEQVFRLTPKEMPPVGEWICSPYDPEIRYGKSDHLSGWDTKSISPSAVMTTFPISLRKFKLCLRLNKIIMRLLLSRKI